MNIVFIHKIFPGQFKHLIKQCSASPEHRVVAVCQEFAPEFHASSYPGCDVRVYEPIQTPSDQTHSYAQRLESDVNNGQAVANLLQDLETGGFHPELILAHTGWGEGLYCKDVFPLTPLIAFFEFFYQSEGADADFARDQRLSLDDRCRIRALNAGQLLNLVSCDAGVSPTRWQRCLYPPEFQGKLYTIHEGIDVAEFKPDRSARFTLPDGAEVAKSDEVITYVSRNLEPYRGFPQFMQAIAILQHRRPHVHVLIAGGDGVSYSQRLQNWKNYREKVCAELDLDMTRVHFLGWLSYALHRKLLQVSSVHVYLTAPFVLSWSMLEAMATACVIVASDSAPVREVVKHGHNGLLCDFFSPTQIANTIETVLEDPVRMKFLGEQARRDVAAAYNTQTANLRYAQLIKNVTGRRFTL